MAPLKRKRPHDAIPDPPAPEPITRRATRQTSIAPLPVQSDPEPRRRRKRGGNKEELDKMQKNGKLGLTKPLDALPVSQPCGKKENIPLPPVHSGPLKPNRATRNGKTKTGIASQPSMPGSSDIENVSPGSTSGPSPLTSVARPTMRPTEPASRRARPIEPHQQSAVQRADMAAPAASIPAHQPPRQQKPAGSTADKSLNGRPDRNIDKVVLGEICFRAWYPSYYGKEVLGDISGNSAKAAMISAANGVNGEDGGGKGQGRRDRDNVPILDRLYVCPCCFKYSKELVAWWEHVRVCETRCFVPGKKIYAHPKGRRKVLIPATTGPKFARGRRGNGAGKMVEGVVQDEGEWSIWVVDGEKDVLFCQNLSLFAKLFLDNKSVFFDVTGFNYFLLVYSPPSPPTPNPNADVSDVIQPRKQIVGFFSKEKLSWDNNNLACILIFPPWQRKGLGSLLMGISYEISRREGLLGGPEKPISDLGKKGYKRFWAGEISRWLLSLDTTGDGAEAVVDTDECSRATWIAPEDCLLVLREMGLVEDAGEVPVPGQDAQDEAEAEAGEVEKQYIRRVRISKEAVRRWVVANGIGLERTCDPEGFIDGYALKPVETEEES